MCSRNLAHCALRVASPSPMWQHASCGLQGILSSDDGAIVEGCGAQVSGDGVRRCGRLAPCLSMPWRWLLSATLSILEVRTADTC